MACALTFGLSGCRHKRVLPPLPPIAEPVDLAQLPSADPPAMIQPPDVTLPPIPIATGPSPRRERRRKTTPTTQNASGSTQTPAADTPAAVSSDDAAIGALSLGGEANPRAQREAADTIGSIDKRLNALPAPRVDEEKAQVSRIKNFLRQAQDALTSGDIEGATTLATKAKLLLDDLQK